MVVHGVAFNPPSFDVKIVAAHIADLQHRAPHLTHLVKFDIAGQPNAYNLPTPSITQLDSLAQFLDDAHSHNFKVILNVYHYGALNHLQTDRHVGGLNIGDPIPWDHPRTMPWSLPPVPDDNLPYFLEWMEPYLTRVNNHPALECVILRGAGHTAFGTEWRGDDGYVERTTLSNFAQNALPLMRSYVNCPVGIHLQPSFFKGKPPYPNSSPQLAVEGIRFWLDFLVSQPTAYLADVTCGRMVPVELVINQCTAANFPVDRLTVSDYKLYHNDTPKLNSYVGYLLRELGDCKRYGVHGTYHWQYWPGGQAISPYTFRGSDGTWNDAIVDAYDYVAKYP